MILANEEISKYFNLKKIPFLYRVHEKPDEKSLEGIIKLLSEYNIKLEEKENIDSIAISKIISNLKWKKEEYMISKEILQSMSKAKNTMISLYDISDYPWNIIHISLHQLEDIPICRYIGL